MPPEREPVGMPTGEILVSCSCGFEAAFDRLRDARGVLAAHEDAGHDAEWEIQRLASGVEEAGADAGVCGDPTPPASPLYRSDL
ncbi:hypothetical protein KVP04_03530 [Halobacterium salinarum]|nr:hypothetical protein [Halobacterium salinarum]MCF2238200.1 hypothetical protein [Halobacterium salinarum]MCF2241877.1 hypothetical protein [Halobacterium salinarum]QRY23555.1 hypothetical protein JT689_05885 [Halobacterium sp. GSL-19]